jgi:hypothetical protein
MPLGLNPVPGSARNLKPIKPIEPIKSIKSIKPIKPIKATVKKNDPEGSTVVWMLGWSEVPASDSKGAEQHIGEEVVEFDHDDGGDGEPDRRKYRSCGEELFHGLGSRVCGWNERLNRY